jgi:hypothetical protein
MALYTADHNSKDGSAYMSTKARSRTIAAIMLTMLASLASPWVTTGAAQAGGADKPRPATFGDCKNENAGVHNGYDCEPAPEGEIELPF